jgi:hypothetical protein
VTRFFVPLLALHASTAVVGLGSILSVALVAAAARRAGGGSAEASTWLRPLLRFSGISLGTMLVTGILMDIAAGGAFHEWWWFRGSVLLLVVTGVLHARARRSVRRGLERDIERDATLRGIERLAYAMSALIAAITVLMEVKPF